MTKKKKPIYRQSMLSSFELCAYSYYLKTVEKKRPRVGFYAVRGSAIHAGREINFKQKKTSGTDLPIDMLLDAARDEVNKRIKDEQVDLKNDEILGGLSKKAAAGIVINESRPLIKIDRQILQPKVQPKEIEFEIAVELPQYEFDLAGIVDLIDKGNVIIDTKTARRMWNDAKIEKSIQPASYWLLTRAILKKEPADFVYHFLLAQKSPRALTVKSPVDERRIRITLDRYMIMHKMIQAGNFPPVEIGHWKCSAKYCNLYYDCKFGAKK